MFYKYLNINFYQINFMNNLKKKFKFNIFNIFKNSLKKTRKKIFSFLSNISFLNKFNDNFYKELKKKLILSEISHDIADKIINYVKLNKCKIKNNDDLKNIIREYILKILFKKEVFNHDIKFFKKPHVILFVGINGVGKTTTIAKLAYFLLNLYKKKIIISASDTFKFSAIQQIKDFGNTMNIPVISGNLRDNPSKVILNSINYGIIHNVDYILIDTSGRLCNKDHLMIKLKQIIKDIKRINATFSHDIFLVLDINNGQNILNQINIFNSYIKLSGLILTKIDGTSKGGVVLKLIKNYDIPIKYATFGENLSDLQIFNIKYFVNSLIS